MANPLEGRALLGMARDNKPDELASAVALGVPVDSPNPIGQTALMVASLWGNLEAIQMLLKLGANPNKTNDGGATALHFAAAAKRNAPAVCELLLAAGADPTVVDDMGCAPYERADDPALRTKLGGPDPRLFEYAAANNAEGLRELLLSGAVTNVRSLDPEGRHALNIAAGCGAHDIIKLIVEVDKELVAIPDMTGNAPLHVAAEEGDEAAVRLLLAALPRDAIDQRNLHLSEYSQGSWVSGSETIMPWNKTALAIAVEAGDEGLTELLLETGADPNVPDFDKAMPLHTAVAAQDLSMVALLLEKGADVNAPNNDTCSCLHAAAQRGPVALLKLLLDKGGNVKVTNEEGWTPLHLAARAGAAEKVRLLLAAGADTAAKTSQGHTPLMLAITNKRDEVQQVLEQAGGSAAQAAAGEPVGVAAGAAC